VTNRLPGPGQYTSQDINQRINKKVWGRQGMFGSGEKRFAEFNNFV